MPTRSSLLRRVACAVAALCLLVLAGCSTNAVPAGPDSAVERSAAALDLGEGWSWQRQAGPLELGVTHTQYTLDDTEPAAARGRGLEILRGGSAIWQNVHLMGFGTLNPEPAPGQFDWSTLDRRMQLVTDTGGRTVLTLCCAPDWMKGGAPGATDWAQLERAPLPEFYDAFAALSAAAVQRYPQVERVIVWNELKGFHLDAENRWDSEGYTALYDKVYAAVKAVRPDVLVGGPYPVMTSWTPGAHDGTAELAGVWGQADRRALDVVEYWLTHKVGGDFLVVDGGTAPRGGVVTGRLDAAATKFADVTSWLQQRSNLPVWWAEFYPDVPPGVDAGPSSRAGAVATLASVGAFASSGVSGALLWGPQGYGLPYATLWTDATKPDGGHPTPLTEAWQWLVPRLARGEVEIGYSLTAPLMAFRAADGGALVVNTGADEVPVPGEDPLPGWAIVHRAPAA